jgi:hypothetical protein
MVILVSEDSNRYAHLFLIEREYFGFNTLESVVCDNFPGQFHFFLGTFHEKHKFKYFKNLTVKVGKFGAMMSICLFFSVGVV